MEKQRQIFMAGAISGINIGLAENPLKKKQHQISQLQPVLLIAVELRYNISDFLR